jgi:hypothetical protein
MTCSILDSACHDLKSRYVNENYKREWQLNSYFFILNTKKIKNKKTLQIYVSTYRLMMFNI